MKDDWCYKNLSLLKGAFLRVNKCITVVIKEQLSLSVLLCISGMNSYISYIRWSESDVPASSEGGVLFPKTSAGHGSISGGQ